MIILMEDDGVSVRNYCLAIPTATSGLEALEHVVWIAGPQRLHKSYRKPLYTVYCDRRFPALRFSSPLHPVVTSFAGSINGMDGSFLDDRSVED